MQYVNIKTEMKIFYKHKDIFTISHQHNHQAPEY